MSEFLWYWNRGSTRVYTRNSDVAEKAMKSGFLVLGVKIKPKIIKGRSL